MNHDKNADKLLLERITGLNKCTRGTLCQLIDSKNDVRGEVGHVPLLPSILSHFTPSSVIISQPRSIKNNMTRHIKLKAQRLKYCDNHPLHK